MEVLRRLGWIPLKKIWAGIPDRKALGAVTASVGREGGSRQARYLATVTLLSFILSIVGQPLRAAGELAEEHAAVADLENRLEKFVLPYSLGRIAGGKYAGGDTLVVYIQDLHCNPEVQENIARIIGLLDSKYGVSRILVEGAPQGKVDTSVLSSLPDGALKTRVLEDLLRKGVLSGAEYYAVVNRQEKLYGIENWNTYAANLASIQRLIARKDDNRAVGARLRDELRGLRKKYLSGKLERLNDYLRGDEEEEKRYLFLARIGETAGESLKEYPNLERYVTARKLKQQIPFRKLPRELNEYVQELKSVLPYSVYETVQEKLREKTADEYYRLAEIADEYSPRLNAKYPAVAKFLEFERLNYTINPGYLLSEESGYAGRVLEKLSARQVDKEVLFLSRTGELFDHLVSLKITPEEFAYLRENAERFKLVLRKYFSADAVSEVVALLDDRELARFYDTNFRRNDIFVDAVTGASSGRKAREAARTVEGYRSVLEQLAGFRDIEVVVTGGFHVGFAQAIGDRNISYLSITPSVQTARDGGLYDQVITGRVDLRALSASALAQPLIQVLGAQYEHPAVQKILQEYVTIVASTLIEEAQSGRVSTADLEAFVARWKNDTHGEFLRDLELTRVAPRIWDIRFAGTTTRIEVTGGDGGKPVIKTASQDRADDAGGTASPVAFSPDEVRESETAFNEFLRGVHETLRRYSNVHRGAGQHSQVSTEAFEGARDKVLSYLKLSRKDHTVIFVDSRRLKTLRSQLKPGSGSAWVSLDEWGLPFGISALAVRTEDLPEGAPFETGGGTVRLVTKGFAVWADEPDKFEAGTPNIVGAIALGKAVEIVRHYGNPAIFQARPRKADTVESVLYQDELSAYTGEELLTRLKGELIGKEANVPIATGERPYTNLDNGASTPSFTPIWDAVAKVLSQPKEVQRRVVAEVRRIAAKFFGAPEEKYDHIFAANTTNAINYVAESYRHRAEQEKDEDFVVVNTLLEHNSNELPWRSIPRSTVKRLAVDDDGFVNIDELRALLYEYNVAKQHGRQRIKLVAVSGASNVLASFNDIAAIAKEAHNYGAEVLVDGAQLTAHRKVDLERDGIDYFAYSGHKVYAPFGSGGLIARKGSLALSDKELTEIKATGDENVAGVTALGKSLDLLGRIGMETVERDEQDITKYALSRFQELRRKNPKIEIYGVSDPGSVNIDRKGGVVVFGIRGIPHNLIAKYLAEQGGIGVRTGCFCAHILVQYLTGMGALRATFAKFVYAHWPEAKWMDLFKPGLVRASFGLENTKADVDHLVGTLERVSRIKISLFNRIVGYFRTGTYGKHIPRTPEQERIETFVEDTVHDTYAVRRVAAASPDEVRESETAFNEFLRGVHETLRRYSNVHRGAGQHSQVSTEAFEGARDKVLSYLKLSRKDHTVIFVDSRRLKTLRSQLKPGSGSAWVSLDEWGLPFGISALAVRTEDLPEGAPFETGGGTVRLVTKGFAVWADEPDKFEAGTPNIVGAIALGKAVEIVRHYGNPAIFQARPRKADTVESVLYQDELSAYTGEELLTRLKGELIGKEANVPIATGERPYTNLDNGASTPSFTPIWDAVAKVLSQPRETQRRVVAEVRRIAAKFFGAPEEKYDHIFAANTTNAINYVAESYRHRAEQEKDEDFVVVNTLLEHNSNELPWRSIPRSTVKRLAVDDDGFVNIDELKALLYEYNVAKQHGRQRIKLVAVSGASNVLASFNDIAAIAKEAHNYGAEVLVDGAQLTAHRKVDLERDGIDYFAYSGHKVYAPFGSGGLIARKGSLALNGQELAEIKATGDENVAGVTALGKSLDLLGRIGMETVERDEQEITKYALSRFQELRRKNPKIEIYGVSDPGSVNIDRKGGVVVFGIRGIPHNLIAKYLAEQGGIGVRTGCFCAHILVQYLTGMGALRATFAKFVYAHWPEAKWMDLFKPGLVRASFGLENTKADVDHLVGTLERVSRIKISLFNRIVGYFRTGTYGKHIPRTPEQERIETFVEDAVHDVYSFKYTAEQAAAAAVKPQNTIKDLSLLPVRTWANSTPAVSAVANSVGFVLAQRGEEDDARGAALERAARGLKTVVVAEWNDGDTEGVLSAGKAVDITVPGPDGAAVRTAAEVYYRAGEGDGKVLELFVKAPPENGTPSAHVIAGTAAALVRELNAEGVFREELFAGQGYDAKAWLLENSGDEKIVEALDYQLDNGEADRKIVYGRWDGAGEDQAKYLTDLAKQYGELAWRDGRRSKIKGTAEQNTSVELWVESAAALPGDGTFEGLARFGRRSDTTDRVIVGLDGNGVRALEINWITVVNDLRARGKIGKSLADELVAEIAGKWSKPEDVVDRARVAALNAGLLRIAAVGLAAEHAGFGEGTDTVQKALQQARTLDARQLLAGLEKDAAPEDLNYAKELALRGFAAELEQNAIAGLTEAQLREQYPLELAARTYVQLKGLGQLREAARRLEKPLVVDLGRDGNPAELARRAGWSLKNAGGIRVDLSAVTDEAQVTALLQELEALVREGVTAGSIAKTAVVKVKADRKFAGKVRKAGFEFNVEADAGNEQLLHAAAADGAVLEFDLLRNQGAADLKKVLQSGVGRIALKVGGIRDGAIIRAKNVDLDGLGLLRLLDVIERLIPGTTVLTPESRYATGIRRGIEEARRLGLSADLEELLAARDGESLSLIWKAIDETSKAEGPAEVDIAVAGGTIGRHISALAVSEQKKKALLETVGTVLKKARGAKGGQGKVYLWELRGLLEGLLRQSLAARSEEAFASGAEERDPRSVEVYEDLLVKISRHIGYVNGKARVLPGLDLEKTVTVLPGLSLVLAPAELKDIVRSISGAVDWQGDARRQGFGLARLAEALNRSRGSEVQRSLLAAVLEKVKGLESPVGNVRELADDELVYWANAEAISRRVSRPKDRISIGAIQELSRRLKPGTGDGDQTLFLALTLSEAGKLPLATAAARRRAIAARTGHPSAFYAAQAFWIGEKLTKPEVERRLSGQAEAAVRFAGTVTGTADPESTAVTLRILFDRLARQETVRIDREFRVGSVEAIRLVLTAA